MSAAAPHSITSSARASNVGGRGVLWSGARDAVIKLADRCGALLSNTLPARGHFHDHPFGLGHCTIKQRSQVRYGSN